MTNVVRMRQQRLPLKVNGHAIDPKFEEFWMLCPKKKGKPVAMAKWAKITSPEGLETETLDRDSGHYIPIELHAEPTELIEAMRKYRKSQFDPMTYKLKDGGKYTCHPATWLNQGRWMDE